LSPQKHPESEQPISFVGGHDEMLASAEGVTKVRVKPAKIRSTKARTVLSQTSVLM